MNDFCCPYEALFFPLLDSVDRKKKDFCINLRHVMRSDVIRSNERIHGIIVLHHKIWQKFPLFVHWKIEIDNVSSNNRFLHFQRAFNGIIHLVILEIKSEFLGNILIIVALCCFYWLSRIHLFCWFHSLPSLWTCVSWTLLVSFQIYYLIMFLQIQRNCSLNGFMRFLLIDISFVKCSVCRFKSQSQ